MGRAIKKDCFWGAEKCVPGSNNACKNCTETKERKHRKCPHQRTVIDITALRAGKKRFLECIDCRGKEAV